MSGIDFEERARTYERGGVDENTEREGEVNSFTVGTVAFFIASASYVNTIARKPEHK